jgi:peptidoglycan/xylan/chitin deacetylase (PgdA/CDA1 family)/tetratricopeptide (TPR) repeat protein
MKRKLAAALGAVLVVSLAVWGLRLARPAIPHDQQLERTLDGIADDYRKVIVLMEGAEELDAAVRARSVAAGRMLFWQKQRAIEEMGGRLAADAGAVRQFSAYVLTNPRLHDADKLAFIDLVEDLESKYPPRRFRPNGLANSLKALKADLASIQLVYREEVTRIFSQFATRGASGAREKWDAYVRYLRTLTSREKILAEFGDAAAVPPEPDEDTRGAARSNEFFGTDFPAKTVALTFDDGPHPRYTEQVLALLRKYNLKACFFELGKNLGTVGAKNEVTLIPTANIAKKVLDAGHIIANHSYSHPVLPKLAVDVRTSEIDRTNLLLEKVAGHKPDLFRAPYGARNKQILDQIGAEGMRSVMWNIDSLDWADPIPESIAMRVLHELNQSHKGIILFHDIHKQSVLALTPVLEELVRQEYTFASYENGRFTKTAPPPPEVKRAEPPAPSAAVQPVAASGEKKTRYYRESWAVIIGINDYQNWPKLRYAVNDATAVEQALVTRFGFKHENIRKLINADATRQRIMEVLGDEFTDGNKVQREDRVFFFFAGHGATRTLQDGRQLGFIVPADADRANYYSTAISMTALREACDLIAAKHVYFVMDSCYSGLALTRGAGGFSRDHSYLEEVTRRVAREILTAGGADQEVSDDGPQGHSVFTWALLQGLQGQADLDGNGVITASELGAYVSPIVSQFSKQTPTVGNLVGSEGGEFIFELQPEPLTSLSEQLDGKALHLNQQLASLEKQVASKQQELLRLQQSIQSESVKLVALRNGEGSAPTAAAVRPKPARAFDLDRQGRQLFRERKYDQALDKVQQAVALKPNDAVLLNNLGFLYYKTGHYDDALKYLEKTLSVDPNRKEAHGNLADAYLKVGRRPEAKAHYERYLELYPTSPRGDEVRQILTTLN